MSKLIRTILLVLIAAAFTISIIFFMTEKDETANMINVAQPLPGAVVGKEFSVTGEARGTWFFEASFPIALIDKDGNVLAVAIAQAQSDWMTEDYVPFKADLVVPGNYTGEATLVLKKDNPSGLPEHDASGSFVIKVEY